MKSSPDEGKGPDAFDQYQHLATFWADILHLMSSKPQALMSVGPMRTLAANSKRIAAEMIEMTEDYAEFGKHLSEYYSQLADTWAEAQKKVNAKAPKVPNDVEQAEALKRIWVDIFDNDFTDLFDSPKFGKNYGGLVSRELELVRHWNNIANIVLKSANLPSKEEMDEVYREIHSLKKRLRISELEIQRLRRRVARDGGDGSAGGGVHDDSKKTGSGKPGTPVQGIAAEQKQSGAPAAPESGRGQDSDPRSTGSAGRGHASPAGARPRDGGRNPAAGTRGQAPAQPRQVRAPDAKSEEPPGPKHGNDSGQPPRGPVRKERGSEPPRPAQSPGNAGQNHAEPEARQAEEPGRRQGEEGGRQGRPESSQAAKGGGGGPAPGKKASKRKRKRKRKRRKKHDGKSGSGQEALSSGSKRPDAAQGAGGSGGRGAEPKGSGAQNRGDSR